MTDGKRRVILIGGALAAVAAIVAGVFVLWPSSSGGDQATRGSTGPAVADKAAPSRGPSTGQLLDGFLKALSAGNAAEAAAFTDNPAAAQEAVTALYKTVPAGYLAYTRTTSASPVQGVVTAPVTAKLSTFASPATWQVSVQMAESGGKWLVKWAPTVIHPKLQTGQTVAVLGKVGKSGEAAVLGDDGKPIVVWDGTTAKPVDPRISPLLMKALLDGTSGGGTTDSRYVAIVDAAGKEVGAPLFGEKPAGSATGAVRSTVNAAVAIAAQNAVAKATQPTYLVAIKPSTGGILAVAQNDAAGTTPNALHGLYAPGSSFKIVTAGAAIQQAGLGPDSPVECPAQATIGGRTLKNAGFDVPGARLRTAFAKSCNTTFGQIAGQLPADGLRKAAGQFGVNADFDIPGIKSELGKVEDAASPVQRVEDSIGQGKVVASPLGMAVVASTVAAKKAITPTLLKDSPTQVLTPYTAPPAAVLGQIQAMMADVVKSGTATELRKYGSVHGKTGTAETESQGDNAHGWFVGFRGDVAFAVLVQDGRTSAQAVSVTGAFLSGF